MYSFSFLRIVPIILALAGSLSAIRAQVQHVSLTGVVVDSLTGMPLEAASVYVPSVGRGSATNDRGEFRIEPLHAGSYEVVVQFLGYREIRETVQLRESIRRRYALIPTVVQLPELTVTGRTQPSGLTGSTQSVAVLTEEQLKQVRGQTIGQTLDKVPGITLMQTGPSIAKPVLRGLHSQRLLITNAGIRQEGQQWGGEHAPEIDPFVVSRVEVLRGAAGVEYGADAIGGVIRLEPRKLRTTTGTAGELTLNGFSNNRQGAVSGWVETKPEWLPALAVRVQGSGRKAGDSRTPAYVISNSGFTEQDGSVYAGYASERAELSAYFSHFETTLGIFSGSHIGNISDLERAINGTRPLVLRPFTYDIVNPKQQVSHDLLSIRGSLRLPSVGRFELTYGWQQNHRQEFDAHKPFSDSLATILLDRAAFDLTLTSYTADLKFHHDPVGPLYGTIGVSGTSQGNVSEGRATMFPNFRVYSGGVFLIEETVSDPWIFNIGLRYDFRFLQTYAVSRGVRVEEQRTYRNISGSVGTIYRFADSWSLGLNVGTAWRAPSINELYSDGVHHGTAQYEIGNPSLGSERSRSVDLTLRHRGPRTTGEASFFVNAFDNYIFAKPALRPTLTIRGAFPTFEFTETRALLYGLDASWEQPLSGMFTVGLTASLVRGDNQTTREPLIMIPADRFRLLGHVDLHSWTGLEQTFLEAGVAMVRSQDRFPAGADYSDPPPGYVVWDVTAGLQFSIGTQPLELYLGVHNLFNTTYRDYLSRFRYFIDEPGRNAILRLHIPFGSHEGDGLYH